MQRAFAWAVLLAGAVACERGELDVLPARAGANAGPDGATALPDQSVPPVRNDAASPPPFNGGTSFECNSNEQCGGRRRRCDARIHRCVECLNTYDCQWPAVCDLFTERCALPCQTHADCSMTAQTRCDPNRFICVGCLNDDQCVSPTEFCERASGQCVECLRDDQCAPPWRFCSPSRNECVECRYDDDCGSGEVCGGGRCLIR